MRELVHSLRITGILYGVVLLCSLNSSVLVKELDLTQTNMYAPVLCLKELVCDFAKVFDRAQKGAHTAAETDMRSAL